MGKTKCWKNGAMEYWNVGENRKEIQEPGNEEEEE
jgi:hypothetical protein